MRKLDVTGEKRSVQAGVHRGTGAVLSAPWAVYGLLGKVLGGENADKKH